MVSIVYWDIVGISWALRTVGFFAWKYDFPLTTCSLQRTDTKELIQLVYGFSLDSMYAQSEDMMLRLQTAKSKLQRQHFQHDQEPIDDRERAIQNEHIHERLRSGGYYRVSKDNESCLVFQVVGKNPARRSYVQRICFLGVDVPTLVLRKFCFTYSNSKYILLFLFWLFRPI